MGRPVYVPGGTHTQQQPWSMLPTQLYPSEGIQGEEELGVGRGPESDVPTLGNLQEVHAPGPMAVL